MRSAMRRRRQLYLAMVGMATIVSSVYGALAGPVAVGHALHGAAVGAIQGFVVSAFIAGGETYGDSTRLGRALERAPFLVTVAVKGLAYGGFIVVVVGGELGVRLLGLRPARPVLDNPLTPLSFTLAFGLTFAVLFVLEISRIVGGRTLRDIVLGRYHRPRREDRFFLFVDITGSTALAERLGPAAVHRFLDRVFRIAADPVDEHHGEVYQYVGDEMVVTWTARSTRRGAAPVACFFAIARAGRAESGRWTRRPRGLHGENTLMRTRIDRRTFLHTATAAVAITGDRDAVGLAHPPVREVPVGCPLRLADHPRSQDRRRLPRPGEGAGLRIHQVPNAAAYWVILTGSPPWDEPVIGWPRAFHAEGAFNLLVAGIHDEEIDAVAREFDPDKRATARETRERRRPSGQGAETSQRRTPGGTTCRTCCMLACRTMTRSRASASTPAPAR